MLYSLAQCPHNRWTACNSVHIQSNLVHDAVLWLAGLVQLLPCIFFVGYECWLLWAIYTTALTENDAFDGKHYPKDDPITERSGQVLLLLTKCGPMVANVLLLLLTTPLILYIGGVFNSLPIHEQVRYHSFHPLCRCYDHFQVSKRC